MGEIMMNWRLASRLSVLTLAVLVVVLVTILGTRSRGGTATGSIDPPAVADPAGLQGTYLGETTAPNFHLADQHGKAVTLSQFRGHPVILTFLYTHCPYQCPLTAEKLRAVMQSLGSPAHGVGVLAVSVDPAGDTRASALSFSHVHRMEGYWHYLLGTQSQLAPVWSSYAVYSAPTPTTAGGAVNHSTAIYIIDQQGRERVLLDNSNSNEQIANDIRILLKTQVTHGPLRHARPARMAESRPEGIKNALKM
jgi:protein SCO1